MAQARFRSDDHEYVNNMPAVRSCHHKLLHGPSLVAVLLSMVYDTCHQNCLPLVLCKQTLKESSATQHFPSTTSQYKVCLVCYAGNMAQSEGTK